MWHFCFVLFYIIFACNSFLIFFFSSGYFARACMLSLYKLFMLLAHDTSFFFFHPLSTVFKNLDKHGLLYIEKVSIIWAQLIFLTLDR